MFSSLTSFFSDSSFTSKECKKDVKKRFCEFEQMSILAIAVIRKTPSFIFLSFSNYLSNFSHIQYPNTSLQGRLRIKLICFPSSFACCSSCNSGCALGKLEQLKLGQKPFTKGKLGEKPLMVEAQNNCIDSKSC